ncbi:hypothetical protein EG327_011706 [Venturia inaequalis]|uniref:Cylicin I n=1 Tax=Venturia inaequalis TaxID=5025 RepID=A0A8H3ZCP9_VENIN|nr:hypothetical protein EG327_011706 [Venturia inaequalis]
MILARATALRASSVNAFARSARTTRSRTSQQCFRLSQQSGRRQYSSAKDHVIQKASSDIPWLVSGIAITIGGTYVALQPHDSGHHDDHDEGHGEDHGEEHEEKEEASEEDSTEESTEESKDEGKSDDGGEEEKDSAGDADKKDAPKDDAPKEDSESQKDGEKEDSESQKDGEKKDSEKSDENPKKSGSAEVSNKGMTKSASNTVKHEETGTGKKLRLDSSAGKTIGEGSSSGDEDDMSHKQRGMSNTDTKHSTDPSKDPEKSKKGEGTVETAKIKGTVDPSRPQV